jgi:hypothetical protein
MNELETDRDTIMERLGELRKGQRDIENQLVALNANVGELWSHVRDAQQGLLKHIADCTLIARVRALEQYVSSEKRADEAVRVENEHDRCTRNKWEDRAWSFGTLVLAVIAGLVLAHADIFRSAAHVTK